MIAPHFILQMTGAYIHELGDLYICGTHRADRTTLRWMQEEKESIQYQKQNQNRNNHMIGVCIPTDQNVLGPIYLLSRFGVGCTDKK